MPECDLRGCSNAADVTVVYEDPEEILVCCMVDGLGMFRQEPRARRIERGVADAGTEGS